MSFISYLINGISLGSIYAIIALGYTMVYGIAKMLNFAHGDVIMIGCYVVFTMMSGMGMPALPSVIAATAICTVLAVFNVPVYMINTKSGCVVTVFTVIYFIVVCLSYNYNKPVLVNELISFATQYGSAQKKLLEEFEIPYALLDHDGKILWLNQNFSEVTGKDKTYHKTINGIFPALTKELIQKEDDVQANYNNCRA